MAKKEIEQTEIEAPYELPEGWMWCRLGEVGETLTGSTPSKKKTEYYGGEFPFFKPADLEQGINLFQSSEYLSAEGKKVSRIVPAKSTLICCIGSIGKSGYSLREGTTNQQINAIIPHKYIDSKYLFYAVNTEDFINQLWSKASSTTISIVNKSKMDNCIIPLPPTLAEQQRIVNRIESMFAKLDEAKEKAQNVVDGFEIRKAAILHKAFTGELTAKWRRENDVGDDSWVEKTIGEICKFIGGGTPDKTNQNYWNGNIHWASVKDIKGDKLFSTEDKITELGLKESSAKLAKIDDIILITRISPGKAIITKIETAVNQDLKIVETKEYKPFLKFFFDFSENEIKLLSSGTTVKGIKLEILNKLSILVPTLPEQQEIVRILDIIIEKENKAKQAAEAVLEQIDLLKKSILARAFRGEL